MPRKYVPTGKPPGRPKGQKNKKPQELTPEQAEFGVVHKVRGQSNSKHIQKLKDRLADWLCSDEEINALISDLHEIKDPKERCAMRRDLFQYVIPKVTAVDMNANLEVESVGDELSKLTHATVQEGAIGLVDEENIVS